jgi:hypothetical protein
LITCVGAIRANASRFSFRPLASFDPLVVGNTDALPRAVAVNIASRSALIITAGSAAFIARTQQGEVARHGNGICRIHTTITKADGMTALIVFE